MTIVLNLIFRELNQMDNSLVDLMTLTIYKMRILVEKMDVDFK